MARDLKVGTIPAQVFREKLAECRREIEQGAILLVTAARRPSFAAMPIEAFDALLALASLEPQQLADLLRNATPETAPAILKILQWVTHQGEPT